MYDIQIYFCITLLHLSIHLINYYYILLFIIIFRFRLGYLLKLNLIETISLNFKASPNKLYK